MSTTRPSLREELDEYNAHLDHCLRSHYGMTLKTFKSIKALTQLAGALAGAYALYLGADPLLTILLITTMVSGPEALEAIINQSTE
jgi:hypothetical protein